MEEDLKQVPVGYFPERLSEIPDPPKKMYLKGELPPHDSKWLTVVGSRAVSAYGRQVCEYLIEGLRGYPIAIVSGLAYGVDTLAHKKALDVGLTCVAVPGSGLDWSVLYPRANLNVAKEILKNGGALVSEFESDLKAAPWTFPRRNRIMVGLAHAVLLIEAGEKSGTLITARLTADYNRELLAVPGSIFSPGSKGTHQFLKLGATLVTEPDDILRALGLEMKTQNVTRADVTEQEQIVLAVLAEPLTRDNLIRALGLSASDAGVLLSTMEIKGLIKEELGTVRRVL